MRLQSGTAFVALAAASVLLLTACGPSSPVHRDDDSDPAETGAPPPTATASGEPTSDVLFTIVATTTDSGGAPVTFTLVGHAPQAWNAPGRAAIAHAYIAGCNALGGGSVSNADGVLDEASLAAYGSMLMVIDVTSTPAGRTLSGPLELTLGSPYYYEVVTGDGVSNPFDESCYGGYQVASTGTVSSITDYESASPTPDPLQWQTGRYGFAAAFGSPATFTACDVQVTSLATSSGVAEVDGWVFDGGSDTQCAIGYEGE